MDEIALMGQAQNVLQYLGAALDPEVRQNFGYQLDDLLKFCEFDQNRCGPA